MTALLKVTSVNGSRLLMTLLTGLAVRDHPALGQLDPSMITLSELVSSSLQNVQ